MNKNEKQFPHKQRLQPVELAFLFLCYSRQDEKIFVESCQHGKQENNCGRERVQFLLLASQLIWYKVLSELDWMPALGRRHGRFKGAVSPKPFGARRIFDLWLHIER